MWKIEKLNIIKNLDILNFNKWANKDFLIDVFKKYYTDKKAYNDLKSVSRQRKEEIRRSVLNRIKKQFMCKWEIDYLKTIIEKEKIIDRQVLIKKLRIKNKSLTKLDAEFYFEIFRFMKWTIEAKYKGKIRNNIILFSNENLKKYFDLVYKTITAKKKEKKIKLSLDSIKKSLSKRIWEELTEIVMNKFCQYIDFYCTKEVIFTTSHPNIIEFVKNFIAKKVKENKSSFMFKELKKEIDNVNTNSLIRNLNILIEQGYIKRIDKGLYKIK